MSHMTLRTKSRYGVRLLLPLALALVVAVPTGLATTAPDLIVPVKVALKSNTVTLSRSHAARGSYVEFRVRNTTASRRLFTVAGRTISIPAGKSRLLAIFFDARARYPYASRVPSGRTIRGTFRIV
jgi:hypothetical protein